MLTSDIGFFCCVDCGNDLVLEKGEIKEEVVINGILRCTRCGRTYPVIDEVGVFFRKDEVAAYLTQWERKKIIALGYDEIPSAMAVPLDGRLRSQTKAASNWDYQHQRIYNWEEDIGTDGFHGSRLFWKFIPLLASQVRDKIVYAACVGRGKEIYHVLQLGARRVIANELGTSLYVRPPILRNRKKEIILLRYDVSYPPLKDAIADVVICDHALQHVYDHKRAFSRFCRTLKPGGRISICVYSNENNYLMTGIIEPLKPILHLLPLKVMRLLAYPPALLIYALIHMVYLPLDSTPFAKRLPLRDHMLFWSKSTLKFIWSACFDLMHAPISYHFRKDEVETLASSNYLTIEKLVNTHGTTWSLVATKMADSHSLD